MLSFHLQSLLALSPDDPSHLFFLPYLIFCDEVLVNEISVGFISDLSLFLCCLFSDYPVNHSSCHTQSHLILFPSVCISSFLAFFYIQSPVFSLSVVCCVLESLVFLFFQHFSSLVTASFVFASIFAATLLFIKFFLCNC